MTDAPGEPASGVTWPRPERRKRAAQQREMNRQPRVWMPRCITGWTPAGFAVLMAAGVNLTASVTVVSAT